MNINGLMIDQSVILLLILCLVVLFMAFYKNRKPKMNFPENNTGNIKQLYARVAWFDSGTRNGELKGYRVGVVVVTNQLGTFARLGIAATPLGGTDGQDGANIDAAFIFYDGAEVDVEAAQRLIEEHGGEEIFID